MLSLSKEMVRVRGSICVERHKSAWRIPFVRRAWRTKIAAMIEHVRLGNVLMTQNDAGLIKIVLVGAFATTWSVGVNIA